MLMTFFREGYWLFAIPFVAYIAYLIFLQFKGNHNKDTKSVRRFYYLASMMWITAVLLNYGNQIIALKIFTQSNIDGGILNLFMIILVFILFTILWDIIFISCQTVSKISLKGVEITTQEFTEAAKAIETTMEDLSQMEQIIRIQNRMFSKMYDYQEKLVNLDEKIIYKELVARYVRLRKNIKIDCYDNNEEGLHLLKKAHKLGDIAFSGIRYALASDGICLPVNGGTSDKLFAVIETAFNSDNMIIVISGARIMRTEHLIIQNIISYFDNIIESEGNKALLEDMKETNAQDCL